MPFWACGFESRSGHYSLRLRSKIKNQNAKIIFKTAKEPVKNTGSNHILILGKRKFIMPTTINKKALIVVDVQNYFVNDYTKSIPNKIANFIQSSKFDLVLFTKFVNYKNSNFFKLLNWRKCLCPPDTDIHPVLVKFINDNNLFKKASYSIFKSDKLVKSLKKSNINQIFLCGIDIDACVLSSAFEGFDLGYQVHILKDLSLSHSGKKLDSAAFEIINKNLEK